MATTAHNGHDRIEAAEARRVSAADLREFFKACDLREDGRELDWAEHLKTIEASRATGQSGT